MNRIYSTICFLAACVMSSATAQDFGSYPLQLPGTSTVPQNYQSLLDSLTSGRAGSNSLLQLNDDMVLQYYPNQTTPTFGNLTVPRVFWQNITPEMLQVDQTVVQTESQKIELYRYGIVPNRDEYVGTLKRLFNSNLPDVARGAKLELAQEYWVNPIKDSETYQASFLLRDIYQGDLETGKLLLEFLNEQPQVDPGATQRLAITKDLANLNDAAAIVSLFRDFNALSGTEALNKISALDIQKNGAYIGDLILELDPNQIEQALSAYREAAPDGPYALARTAQLSLQYPNLPNALTRSEAFSSLYTAANQSEAQAFVALAEESNSPQFSFELSLSGVSMALTDTQKQAMNKAANFGCSINVDAFECPSLPLFYVTDRAVSGSGDDRSFDDMLGDGRLQMGFSQQKVLVNTQISDETLNFVQTSVRTYCGENGGWLCDNQRQPLDISTPAIYSPTDDQDAFVKSVADFAESSDLKRVVIYVHGFNNDFNLAAKRFANIMEKAEYPAVPILFSFASRGQSIATWDSIERQLALAYRVDLATSAQSCARFRPVIDAIVAEFGSDNVDLLAHSMGANITLEMALGCNRATIPAAADLLPWSGRMFRSVILGAPDITLSTFAEHYEQFRSISQYLTIYASTNDIALRTSNLVNRSKVRLGQGGSSRSLYPGSMTIDATGVEYFGDETNLLNHAYMLTVGEVRRDLSMLLNGFFDDTVVRCIVPDISQEFFFIQPRCNL